MNSVSAIGRLVDPDEDFSMRDNDCPGDCCYRPESAPMTVSRAIRQIRNLCPNFTVGVVATVFEHAADGSVSANWTVTVHDGSGTFGCRTFGGKSLASATLLAVDYYSEQLAPFAEADLALEGVDA